MFTNLFSVCTEAELLEETRKELLEDGIYTYFILAFARAK